MTAAEVEAILSSQYIDEKRSKFLKVKLKDFSTCYGEFIKENQLFLNRFLNRWVLSTADNFDLIDGKEIKAIYIFGKK